MKDVINRSIGVPIYIQLKAWLEKAIDRGELQPGKRIPSENTLSRRNKVHRNTIRNALSQLEWEGMIYSVPGSGWFVKPQERKLRTVGVITTTEPGAVVPSYYSEFSERFNRGLLEGAARYGFDVHRIGEEEVKQLHSGKELDFEPEAFVWIDSGLNPLPFLKTLKQIGIPLLLANRQFFGENIPSVTIDQYYSTLSLVSRLTRRGHHRIGCITSDMPLRYVSERFQGYCNALTEIGLVPDKKLICKIKDMKTARRKIYDFLKSRTDMTGLFIAGEAFHEYTFDILKKLDRQIPEDLSIVTFDRVAGDTGTIVALDQPLEELGRRVFRTLDMMFAGERVAGEILKPLITQGKSIKNINSA